MKYLIGFIVLAGVVVLIILNKDKLFKADRPEPEPEHTARPKNFKPFELKTPSLTLNNAPTFTPVDSGSTDIGTPGSRMLSTPNVSFSLMKKNTQLFQN